ncbi:MAG: HlyD family efflux transporter periplasmic adaptor subunit [Chloroflexi bacterium]|nr:HlyD family efflux transporter periplasmic adaptor subunit [Chloroflexota bacterium]
MKRIWLWIGLIGVAIVAVVWVGTAVFRPNKAPAATADNAPANTAEVVIADLTQEETYYGKLESVTGVGTLIPAAQIELAFTTPGVVSDIVAVVGQTVQAGDVLAQVDAAALAAQDEISVAQAQINLDVAQQALDDWLNWEQDAAEIAQLEADVAAAQAAYNAALGQEAAASTNITVSHIGVDQAERQLAAAQEVYDTVFDPGRDWELNYGDALLDEREAAAAGLQYAQENLQIAQLNYNASVSSSGSSGSANAQSALLSAEQALATALAGPTDEQITAAETAVAQAQLNLQQAQLNQAANLAGAILTAPIDGTILSVNGHLGGQAGFIPFITLADLTQPTLEVFLDETNLDKIGVGSTIEAVFSAIPTETFNGRIIQIDPQLAPSGNALNSVRALAQLNTDQSLPAGLTAAVNVTDLATRLVRVNLPLDDEGMLAVGDPVAVELPDLSQLPGMVVFVPQTPTVSNSGQPVFEALVEIAAGNVTNLADLPDRTSVDVIFVSDSAMDVMAIPVSALAALLEGGYAVEVETALGAPRLVAVEVGFYGSNNMIAVTSDGLKPGDKVIVP